MNSISSGAEVLVRAKRPDNCFILSARFYSPRLASRFYESRQEVEVARLSAAGALTGGPFEPAGTDEPGRTRSVPEPGSWANEEGSGVVGSRVEGLCFTRLCRSRSRTATSERQHRSERWAPTGA